jgi:hypothetical protein
MTPFKKKLQEKEREKFVFTFDLRNADLPMANGSLSGLKWPFGLLAM